ISASTRKRLEEAGGRCVPAAEPPSAVTIGDGIVVLQRVHRFGPGIAELAEAVRRGDAEAAITVLEEGREDVTWIQVDPEDTDSDNVIERLRDSSVAASRAVIEAARDGDAQDALEAMRRFRLLCAHRRGPHGVATWNVQIES